MKLFALLFIILTTSAMAQVSIEFNRDYRRDAGDFRYLENPARLEIEPMYKNFVANVEQLYNVKCGKLEIGYGYRGHVERDHLKTECTSEKGSVKIRVTTQNSRNKTFIRALKVLPGKGMRSQF